jgi:hypothetical protein
MNKLLVGLFASAAMMAAVLTVGSAGALAREQTTAPGYNFKINVYITAKGVTLDRSVAKRGWLAHFIVHNNTKKPVRFEVGGLKTRLIAPGKIGRVGAFLDDRGQFDYKVDNHLKGYFQVV